jgi:predicted nucleotidyltransferase
MRTDKNIFLELKQKLISRICEIDPSKIILFGSYSNGSHSSTSDIDLFVIKNSEKDEVRNIKIDLKMKLLDVVLDHKVSIDVFVDSQERFDFRLNNIKDQFYQEIDNSGLVLYAK